MKRVAYFTLIVMAVLTVLILLWQLRQVVVIFFLSIATASAFRPWIDWLKERGLPRSGALLLGYLSVLAVIVGLGYLVSSPLVFDLQNLSNRVAIAYDVVKTTWPGGSPLQSSIAQQLPTLGDMAELVLGADAAESLQTLAGVSSATLNFLGNAALILILSLYWSADYLRFERLWLAMLTPETRPQARETFQAIVSNVGAYIRSEVIQALLAGLLLWMGYMALGMQYAVLMAVFGGLAWLVPWFGAVFAMLPPLLLGYVQGGPLMAGLVLAYTLLVLYVLERIIEPRFFRRETYSSVILVVMILILSDEYGLLGLVLAPLASAAIQITLRYVLQPPATVVIPTELDVAQVGLEIQRLEEQIRSVEETFEGSEEEPALELLSKIETLKKLAAEARQYIEARPELIKRTQPPKEQSRMPLPE